MRILGVDPGSRHTGYGCIDRDGNDSRVVAFGRVSVGRSPLSERLVELADGLETVVEELSPDLVALETPFHGMNTRSLIVLAQTRGALLVGLARRDLAVEEYSPAEIKQSVAGNGRAGKEQVKRMVRTLLGIDADDLSDDAADALAVAICCAARRPLREAVRRATGESR